ncbi:hypothetical protein NUW54_g13998 [Trametes sanguinea]|uniref:Uncharacterized protein n=1 Tax=Trametes sanguinea TaxID=158606 RepID=A0ACC1MHI3_9APHY|nr:hypothetical protein NUW54_g13998 [Trametes sanguinea]
MAEGLLFRTVCSPPPPLSPFVLSSRRRPASFSSSEAARGPHPRIPLCPYPHSTRIPSCLPNTPSPSTQRSLACPVLQPHSTRLPARSSTARTMEIYTTSFTYPRRLRHAHSPTNSLDFPSRSELRRASSYSQIQQPSSNGLADPQATASASDYDALQKLAMMAMSMHGVHVSFTPADQGRAWNFQISGAYPQVMLA